MYMLLCTYAYAIKYVISGCHIQINPYKLYLKISWIMLSPLYAQSLLVSTADTICCRLVN